MTKEQTSVGGREAFEAYFNDYRKKYHLSDQQADEEREGCWLAWQAALTHSAERSDNSFSDLASVSKYADPLSQFHPATQSPPASEQGEHVIPTMGSPLQKLGAWLADQLDEDRWPTAERMLFEVMDDHPAQPANNGAMPDFNDHRVQSVYEILCSDQPAPSGKHWEGFVARRIVEALSLPAVSQWQEGAIKEAMMAEAAEWTGDSRGAVFRAFDGVAGRLGVKLSREEFWTQDTTNRQTTSPIADKGE